VILVCESCSSSLVEWYPCMYSCEKPSLTWQTNVMAFFKALCNDTASCWYYVVSVTDEELNGCRKLVEWHGQVKTNLSTTNTTLTGLGFNLVLVMRGCWPTMWAMAWPRLEIKPARTKMYIHDSVSDKAIAYIGFIDFKKCSASASLLKMQFVALCWHY